MNIESILQINNIRPLFLERNFLVLVSATRILQFLYLISLIFLTSIHMEQTS